MNFLPLPVTFEMHTIFSGEGRLETTLHEPHRLRHQISIPYHRSTGSRGLLSSQTIGEIDELSDDFSAIDALQSILRGPSMFCLVYSSANRVKIRSS